MKVGMEDIIWIRLAGVEFPTNGDKGDETCTVSFNLLKNKEPDLGPHTLISTLKQEVPLIRKEHSEDYDHDAIISAAAKKMESDFNRVLGNLSKYI